MLKCIVVLVSGFGIWCSLHSTKKSREAMMFRLPFCIFATVLSLFATQASAQFADFRPVTEEMLANPDPGDWLMISRIFDQHRFSPLK